MIQSPTTTPLFSLISSLTFTSDRKIICILWKRINKFLLPLQKQTKTQTPKAQKHESTQPSTFCASQRRKREFE